MLTEFTRAGVGGAAATSAETVQLWAKRLWIEAVRVIFWGQFFGESEESIIQTKTDLEGGPGDRLTFTLMSKLDGAGVSGDDTLEGAEEQMVPYSDDVTLDQRRNAVRLKGSLSEMRTAFNQRETAKTLLKTWLAETIDDGIFSDWDDSPTNVVFGGTATSVATLVATGLITPARIDSAVAKAKKADPKIWAALVGRQRYYVLVLHPDVVYDLRNNATWQGYQQNGAQVTGDENPIFSGMVGLYNGVVIHEHEKVPIAANGGAAQDVPYASCPFLGRQAGVFGWGKRPQAWEKEFDYGNQTGFAIGAIWDFTKAVFNNNDYAFQALRVARTSN